MSFVLRTKVFSNCEKVRNIIITLIKSKILVDFVQPSDSLIMLTKKINITQNNTKKSSKAEYFANHIW